MEIVPTVAAYRCFLLHNYCESKGNSLDDEVQAQILLHHSEEERLSNKPDLVYSCQTSEGEYVRTVLTKYIQQNMPDDY